VSAAALLLAVLAAWGFWFPNESPAGYGVARPSDPTQDARSDADTRPPAALSESVKPVTPGSVAERAVRSAQELLDAVREGGSKTLTLTGGLYEWGASNQDDTGAAPTLVVARDEITIQGFAERRPVLRLSGGPTAGRGDDTRAAITLLGGTLTLRRLRIELDAGAGPAHLVALRVPSGDLVVEQCEFVQRGVEEARGRPDPMSVLQVAPDGPARPAAGVVFRECVFYGGLSGFALDDSARVHFQDCVFGPYDQAFRIHRHAGASVPPGMLKLVHCSWLVGKHPAIWADARPEYLLDIRQSILSAPSEPDANAGGVPVLVLGPDTDTEMTFQSVDNLYHNVAALVAKQTEAGRVEPLVPDLAGRASDRYERFQDVGSRAGPASPWEEAQPIRRLADNEPAAARAAFRADLRSADVRLPAPVLVRGARRVLDEDLYPWLDRASHSQGRAGAARRMVSEVIGR
jgi:hypothetical protein